MSLILAFLLSSLNSFAIDEFTEKIKPIFDNRCIACHSCYNAPCQLNLQTYDGFDRGASKQLVYEGSRIHSVMPTRMEVDATSTSQWRAKKFYPVNSSQDLTKNILAKVLAVKDRKVVAPVKLQVADSQTCPDKASEVSEAIGMPYGLPALEKAEQETIESWLKKGAPGPKKTASTKFIRTKEMVAYESWLNKKSLKQKIVSRYIFEHLFLAHLYFKEQPNKFFRLVRSRSSCLRGVDEIATRRPNDDTGRDHFYCFKPYQGTIVTKTHIPYELGLVKLKRWESIFFGTAWKATTLPSFEAKVAENPFVAFKDIPVKSRYKFLLEDARYHINTFIKGPVCNGSQAVNSIQEHFFVFFMDPEADLMANHPDYEKQVRVPLILPGVWGSDVPPLEAASLTGKLIEHREEYRKIRNDWKEKSHPEGYKFEEIWNGDNYTNPNSFLTVFRHDDNAVVLYGAVGDIPKTVFMLDYALMERLVYNLVVNFDVFGNIGHQLLTRVYMDMIRMEAEEMFLAFLPKSQREKLRNEWYQGVLTEAKMKYVFPLLGKDIPTQIQYKDVSKSKQELIEKVLWNEGKGLEIHALDTINWKDMRSPIPVKREVVEEQLARIASINSEVKFKFPQFFPEVSYLLLKEESGKNRFFTLIRNREHSNISWILGEELRMAPVEDTLSIYEGYAANYPNFFFLVDQSELKNWVEAVQRIKTAEDFEKMTQTWGVPRTSSQFWSTYDEIHRLFKTREPIEFGYLDLTRYSL